MISLYRVALISPFLMQIKEWGVTRGLGAASGDLMWPHHGDRRWVKVQFTIRGSLPACLWALWARPLTSQLEGIFTDQTHTYTHTAHGWQSTHFPGRTLTLTPSPHTHSTHLPPSFILPKQACCRPVAHASHPKPGHLMWMGAQFTSVLDAKSKQEHWGIVVRPNGHLSVPSLFYFFIPFFF